MIETLVGEAFDIGLETGSKPELLLATAYQKKGGTIICNGFKDQAYIEQALESRKAGFDTKIVVDRAAELPIILAAAKKIGVKPSIGFRIKLSTKGSGKWGSTTGSGSKFGLTVREVVEAVELLKSLSELENLTMIHFHMGSQMTRLKTLELGLIEASQVYIQLVKMGATGLRAMDVGGGLGVSYSNSSEQKPIELEQYSRIILSTIKRKLDEQGITLPKILSESGRYLTSNHALYLVDIFGAEGDGATQNPKYLKNLLAKVKSDAPEELIKIKSNALGLITFAGVTGNHFNPKNFEEFYTEFISHFRKNLTESFNEGRLTLTERSLGEEILDEIQAFSSNGPGETKKYFANFSLFSALLDSWSIGQTFPIVPIQRLGENPTERARVCDITCDSDGTIGQYSVGGKVQDWIPLHRYSEGESMSLAFGLVGSYQEVLGNRHNLFGKSAVVEVTIDSEGEPSLEFFTGENSGTVINTELGITSPQLIDKLPEGISMKTTLRATPYLD